MKQFLASDAKDKVLTKWRSLKLSPYESIHKYVDKFWDLHLKATVYKKIDFEEKKQQFCVGLSEDLNEYVNSQRPRSISTVIHHTMVAARINFQQGAKKNLKPMEAKDKQEYKGKNPSQNSSKSNSNNNKAKEKGVFKGKNKLNPEELERYHRENKCFKCGEQGHSYRSCPQRNNRNEQPRASMVEAPKEDVHCKGSPLSYAWGKVREHDAFILFDPGSTHNFISLELATKLGVQDFEMGDAMKAEGAFIGQDVSVTPLIGKLRLHIQGEKDMYINAQESGSTIPLVNDQAFDKSIKSSIFAYMIFIKDSLNGVDETQVNENGMQVDLELSNFLNQFQDVFIDDVLGELPPKRGNDDHTIELIPGSSPPNKPPYRVSQAQQEEIMRQVNELVEKEMVRPSSSPFCSPVLLVQKKDGTYWPQDLLAPAIVFVSKDGGAQICVMSEHVFHRLGLKISAPAPYKAKMANNVKVKCLGIVNGVRVKVCEVEVELDVYVMPTKGEGYPIILGRPWLMIMQARQDWGTGMLELSPHKGSGKKTKVVRYDMKAGKQGTMRFETSADEFSSSIYSITTEEESTTLKESDSSKEEVISLILTEPNKVDPPDIPRVEESKLAKMLAKDLREEEKQAYLTMLEDFPRLFMKDMTKSLESLSCNTTSI
ncbi:hypothetical protein L7F22_066972 [Adiantum nelumboides]|nr:hypothetical protein [Adiantum nelumboides]